MKGRRENDLEGIEVPAAPASFAEMLPGAQPVPVLRFSVDGAERVLYQLSEPEPPQNPTPW